MAQAEGRNWAGILTAVTMVALVGFVVGTRQAPTTSSGEDAASPEGQAQTTLVTSITYDGRDGKTAFELLKASHEVESQDSDAGVFVTKINGVGGDADTYWLYYVDGKVAIMAADKYETRNGQKIEWRYEKF